MPDSLLNDEARRVEKFVTHLTTLLLFIPLSCLLWHCAGNLGTKGKEEFSLCIGIVNLAIWSTCASLYWWVKSTMGSLEELLPAVGQL